MTDLLSVPPRERIKLLNEVSEDDRAHFFATSKCPITKEVDDMMEELSRVCLRRNKLLLTS